MNNASQNRILFLYKWLNEETDCDHPLTSKDILKRWDQLGFSTDRRSVYKDIETLINQSNSKLGIVYEN